MTQFVQVPPERLEADTLQALLEDYASRDGTDYGEQELSLARKVDDLRNQLRRGDLLIVCELDGEHWDLLPAERARELLGA